MCGSEASCCSLCSLEYWGGIHLDCPLTKAVTSPLSLKWAAPPHTQAKDGAPLLGEVACEVPDDRERRLTDHIHECCRQKQYDCRNKKGVGEIPRPSNTAEGQTMLETGLILCSRVWVLNHQEAICPPEN